MMAQEQGSTSRTTTPNSDPRLKDAKSSARSDAIVYKRESGAGKSQKRDYRSRR